MNKLKKTFKINPLYESDGYKLGHPNMLADFTSRLYGTWIPRSTKHMPGGIDKVMSSGQQMVVRYLHSAFEENFFSINKKDSMKFVDDMSFYLGEKYDGKYFEDLWDLGYLPIKIKSLPEGLFTKTNIPHMTFINTIDGFAWLTLFLETLISKLSWRITTAATLAFEFKKNAVEWVKKTDIGNIGMVEFMCHDFHSRGGNPFDSIAVGLGHSMSHLGSDTLNIIPASRYYYDFDENSTPIFSVNASEHSVSTTKIFTVGERQMLIDWFKKFHSGILSVVSDTFDLWKLITEYLSDPEVKDLIMNRDGKIVIRPDSGNPVDIICGENNEFGKGESPKDKGVVELLWDIFGGTINEQGFKVLDPHIGCIYGDSINLQRQVEIYERLAKKGFAATNIVCGIGSYSYIFNTRDSLGFAAKGSWFEIKQPNTHVQNFNIYKDPITDDGTKTSLKGFLQVYGESDSLDTIDNIKVKQECSESEESMGLLQTIYEDGKFNNQTTLTDIRDKVRNYLNY